MIRRHLYQLLARSSAVKYAVKNQGHTFELTLLATCMVAVFLLLQLVFSVFIMGNFHIASRILLAASIVLYIFIAKRVHTQFQTVARWMLVALYLVIGFGVLFLWGVNSPIGILTLGFVIFLSNIILGSRHVLTTTLLVICGLLTIQTISSIGIYVPDITRFQQLSSFADTLGYVAVFTIFAVTAWISSRQNELSLAVAHKAKNELKREQRLLAKRLKAQETHLRIAQLEEMRQLYKFAELGQLTSSLLHELANHISILNLDVQTLSKRENAEAMRHIDESVARIDMMIKNVRSRIAHTNHRQRFSVVECVETVISDTNAIKNLRPLKISLSLDNKLTRNSTHLYGDPMRLGQVITILINNAIQAVVESGTSKPSDIRILLVSSKSNVELHVVDQGIGIPPTKQTALFSPQRSSKKNGLGIGLYIASEFIHTHFDGTIEIDSEHFKTCFKISIPISLASS